MKTLTKTLSLTATTIALLGGMGFAHAQANGASGDPLINPDPNAPITSPSTSRSMTPPDQQDRTAGAGVESNTTYGHSRDANNANNNAPSQSSLAGEGVRSNNSYGNTREPNGANNNADRN